jgi:hypothetical protein
VERLEQARGLQGGLAGVFMDIEHAALVAGGCRCVTLIDLGVNPVRMQNTSKRQPAHSRTDDSDHHSPRKALLVKPSRWGSNHSHSVVPEARYSHSIVPGGLEVIS